MFSGNKILKGFIDKDMVNGAVTFDKIQIKEVTSHFRNGWVFFVVYPKISHVGGNNFAGKDNVVNAQKIRPLIIEKVIVKAKKAKEKDAEEPEDAIFQQEEESETPIPQPTEENPKQEIKA